MKKWIISTLVISILGLIVSIGIYIYNTSNTSTRIEDAKINIEDNKKANAEESVESSINYIDEDIIQTSRIEEKVSPDATLIIKKYYKSCGHTTKDYATVPEEIVNKSENEVKQLYSNWEIKGFSPDEIVLYKQLDGICNEHYVLRQLDGVIAVYTMNNEGKEILQEKTSITTEYLPEEDLDKLGVGIKVTGKENLNSLLEDYE